jgi:BirA family transcriptional regulator, biotin operon repressor / biotin---[acetyl-CoA-carboxylase] ligase
MPSGSPYVDLDRPPLRAEDLRRALTGPRRFVSDLQVVTETGSTNAELRARALDGAAEGSVLVAEHQSAGRGRLDRGWSSPPRSGLTFSILLRPGEEVAAHRWPWLPLLAGCAVVEAVAAISGVRPVLKWPNDVLLAERKLAGILVERVEIPGDPAAVVGIGLNVTNAPDELPDDRAISLRLGGAADTDRSTLLVALLRTFETLYRAWRDAHGDPAEGAGGGLRQAYLRRCATIGRQVRVQVGPERWIEGRAREVDAVGRLVVETSSGDRALGAGDVVHVR